MRLYFDCGAGGRVAGLGLMLALVLVLSTGCSQAQRREQAFDQARTAFEKGNYEAAFELYQVIPQSYLTNAVDLRNLAIIVFDRGSPLRAFGILKQAKSLLPEDAEIAARYAALLRAQGNVEQARQEAWIALRQQPELEEPLLLLADTTRDDAEREEIRRFIQDRRAAGPDRAVYHMAEAELGRGEIRMGEVLTILQRAVAAEPGSWRAQQALGGLLLFTNVVEGGEALRKAAELAPPRTTAPIRYASYLAGTGKTNEAERVLLEVTQSTPDYLPAWLALAQTAFGRGDLTGTGRYLNAVLGRDPHHFEAGLLRARLLLREQDAAGQPKTGEALARLGQLAQLYGEQPVLLHYLGIAQFQDGQLEAAARSLERAAPAIPEARLLFAQVNLQRGQYTAAIETLRQHLEAYPQDHRARLVLADALRLADAPTGQVPAYREEAIAIYRAAADRDTNNYQSRLIAGTMLAQQTNYSAARAEFERGIETAPQPAARYPFLFQLVNLDIAQTNYHTALERIAPFRVADPGNAAPFYLEGEVHLAARDYDRAIEVLTRAIDVDPGFQSAYFLLSDAYRRSGRFTEALPKLRELARMSPDNPRTQLLLASAATATGDLAEAERAYRKTLEVDPDFVPALNNLAYLLAENLNRPKEALDLAGRALERAPGEAYVRDTHAWALFRNGRYADALSRLRDVASALPQNAEVQYHLGMAHYFMGNLSEARAALETALNLSAESETQPEPWRQDARLRLERIDAPTADLARLLGQDPQDVVLRYRLAEASVEAGQYAEAAAHYRAALEVNPHAVRVLAPAARLDALHLNNITAARQKVSRLLELAPGDPGVVRVAGQVELAAGDNLPLAHTRLSDADFRAPGNPENLFDLGRAAFALGRIEEAGRHFNNALKANPEFPRANEANWYRTLIAAVASPATLAGQESLVTQALAAQPDFLPARYARALLAEQRSASADAAGFYEDILKSTPTFTPAKRQLAFLLEQSGSDDARAQQLFGELREANVRDFPVTFAAGRVNLRRGQHDRALLLLQEALREQPQNPEVMFYLGRAQLAAGRAEDGRKTLQQALDTGLAEPRMGEARKLLDTP